MAVAHLEVTRRSPFAFEYERVDGKLHFAVNPGNAANARIVDLDTAPRDAEGNVRFWADFVLLRPADAARGNRRLLYYVVNRGLRVGVPFNRFAPRLPTLAPSDDIDVGDGFLMKKGWTVAMCGWQWDVERQPGLMGLEAPQALDARGQPIKGRIAIAFQPNEAHTYHRLSHWPLHPRPGRQAFLHQPYPAADVDLPPSSLAIVGASRVTRAASPDRTTRTCGWRGASSQASGTRSPTPRASVPWSEQACWPRATASHGCDMTIRLEIESTSPTDTVDRSAVDFCANSSTTA
jgi:hypothetical protein